MTKKHFIALADAIRYYNANASESDPAFTQGQIESLACFCHRQNGHFNNDRWIGYIEGRNGKNGGKV